MTLRLCVIVGLLGITIACSREAGSPPSDALAPAAPSPIATAPSATATAPSANAAPQGREDITVNMADACDPDTFNAAIAPGTCTRSGGMKFDRFIDLLTRLAFVGPWHFAPNTVKARVGATFVAVNKGGEVHTFTEVAAFGGGIVPDLNQLSRTPEVAPECTQLDGDDFVAPGAAYREEVEHSGHLKFQCCIHPWMRLEAEAAAR
jgi:plastocyanin